MHITPGGKRAAAGRWTAGLLAAAAVSTAVLAGLRMPEPAERAVAVSAAQAAPPAADTRPAAPPQQEAAPPAGTAPAVPDAPAPPAAAPPAAAPPTTTAEAPQAPPPPAGADVSEREGFIRAANQACQAGQQAARQVPPPHHERDVPPYLARLRAISAEMQQALRALPRPAGDAALLTEHLHDPLADQLARTPSVHRAAAEAVTPQEREHARRLLEDLRQDMETTNAFALSFGLTTCAASP